MAWEVSLRRVAGEDRTAHLSLSWTGVAEAHDVRLEPALGVVLAVGPPSLTGGPWDDVLLSWAPGRDEPHVVLVWRDRPHGRERRSCIRLLG